jgi:hypothetical protein
MQPTDENQLLGFLQEAFKEDNGNPSSMRVLSTVSLIAAISFGALALFNPVTEVIALNLTIAFLTAAFAPKAVQKFAEKPPTEKPPAGEPSAPKH